VLDYWKYSDKFIINKIWKLKLRFVKFGVKQNQSLSESTQVRSTSAAAINLILMIIVEEIWVDLN
jgi:hypothetical protein